MSLQQSSLPLHTGATIPAVGLGTWQAPPGEVGAAVKVALECGYRHIDCAACYGNEAEVGEVLAAFLESHPREELFVTGKLWNSEHAPENVESALRQTLEELKLSYVDLYLIHWPQAFEKVPGTNRAFPKNEDGTMKYDTETTLAATWKALEEMVKKGLCKAIGLSNFNSVQIAHIMEIAEVKPAMLQCESHPFFQQDQLFSFAKKHGIVCTAYSPLGTGAEIGGSTIPAHPALKEIGAKYGKSAAQVAIAWQRQRGIVVIPKSVTAERIAQNLDVNFEMSEEDMKAIKGLEASCRCGWGGPKVERGGEMQPRDVVHPNYPFRPEVEF